ncbi:MAG: AbrB/MazE/SpoVT family DNA-binding domain-containing protein [Methylococcaceae bacterium]
MQITQLSDNRNVFIPKSICDAYHLAIGQELEIELTPQGILLKPKTVLPKTNIDDIAGCLAYQGKAKTIEEMNEGIKQAIIEKWG